MIVISSNHPNNHPASKVWQFVQKPGSCRVVVQFSRTATQQLPGFWKNCYTVLAGWLFGWLLLNSINNLNNFSRANASAMGIDPEDSEHQNWKWRANFNKKRLIYSSGLLRYINVVLPNKIRRLVKSQWQQRHELNLEVKQSKERSSRGKEKFMGQLGYDHTEAKWQKFVNNIL